MMCGCNSVACGNMSVMVGGKARWRLLEGKHGKEGS